MVNYPNMQAIVKSSACGKNRCTIEMKKYAREWIKTAVDYCKEHLKADIISVP